MNHAPPATAINLPDALALGPPRADNLAVPVFAHGTLEVELYAPSGVDPQQPHDRDEAYVVARGTATFVDDGTRSSVEPGAFIFVAAGRPHRFESMSADFAVWVLFYGPVGGEGESAGLPR